MHNGNLRKFERPILFSIGSSKEFGVETWETVDTHIQRIPCEFVGDDCGGVLGACCRIRKIF
jgi:hypothetical protein